METVVICGMEWVVASRRDGQWTSLHLMRGGRIRAAMYRREVGGFTLHVLQPDGYVAESILDDPSKAASLVA